MRRMIAKGVAFVCVFLVTLIVTGIFMNQGNTDMTAPMSRASLPTIGIFTQNREINLMRGYLDRMDPAGMREGITPLGEHRQVDALIHTYGTAVSRVAYEVRSVDGSRLVENSQVEELTREGGDIRVSFRLKDLIEAGEEYTLLFILTLEDQREVYYYTRVIETELFLKEKLDFILRFSDATLDYEKLQEEGFARKLEPNAEGNNSTLARVNIHSSARQAAWAGLAVRRETDPEIQIREISPQTASVTLSYLVSLPYNGERVSAWVEEYYRVRYTPDNMYLLDYERTAQQLFVENTSRFANNKISLGIAEEEVEMMESDGGSVFAFSHAGTLYSYNSADNRLARLFSFYDDEGDDARTRYDRHAYRILQVDETGNVVFLVYGYMNRGRHEGHCGVQVCYYSSTMNVLEEMAFVPYDKSPQILEAEVENLSYVNGMNQLYLMMGGNLFCIDLENRSNTILAQHMEESNYQVTQNGSMAAWQQDGKESGGSSLIFMDMGSAKTTQIEAGEGNRIRPLGFMGEDLIYGIASTSDMEGDSLGNILFPMHSIVICNFQGDVLKKYRQDGLYVTDCEIVGNQINLERVSRTENGFEAAKPDQILYSDQMQESVNAVETAVTENVETVVQISVCRQMEDKKVIFLTPREVLFEGNRDIFLEYETDPPCYYVYGKNGSVRIISSLPAAVEAAYENAGTVAAADGSYVFQRDRLHTANQIMAITGTQMQDGESSLAVCLDAIFRFEGKTPNSAILMAEGLDVTEILKKHLSDRKILNLQGCSLDMALYYPDREIPVLTVLQDKNAVLITGFNEQNVVLMDPQTGTVYKMGMNDARSLFTENGNRFVTYR